MFAVAEGMMIHSRTKVDDVLKSLAYTVKGMEMRVLILGGGKKSGYMRTAVRDLGVAMLMSGREFEGVIIEQARHGLLWGREIRGKPERAEGVIQVFY